MNHAVIMAGGRGTRFWPKSRETFPKHLLTLVGKQSLLQSTVDRLRPLFSRRNIWVVSGSSHAWHTIRQLRELPRKHILVEPLGRNTAACIGWAAITVAKKDPRAVLAVLPADLYIRDHRCFLRVLRSALLTAAKEQCIVTLGIRPSYPATGFGYIRLGKRLGRVGQESVFEVNQFVEKPNERTAKQYAASRKYLWNSGMFVWPVQTILAEIRTHMPRLFAGLLRIQKALGSRQEQDVLRRVYARLPSISIDYGVLEHTRRVLVVPGDFGWSDVGSWAALSEIWPKDRDGNVKRGPVVSVNSCGNVISADRRLVAVAGLKDAVIVDTPDALLVCSKQAVQDVKQLVSVLEKRGLKQYL